MTSTKMNALMFSENDPPLKAGLYVCPTPIGNLEDLTFRVLRVLQQVDSVAAEDTRHTLKLFNHYGIKKQLISYHEHNIRSRGPELVRRIQEGERIALVSDAGMPGISDPGADLIKLCREENLLVTVLPGPTASITALVGSGLRTDRFMFEGFLDRKSSSRKERLRELFTFPGTVILYESPHRLESLLEDMLSVMGDYPIVISREITKKFEESTRASIEHWLERHRQQPVKGELVILFEGQEPIHSVEVMGEEDLLDLLATGKPLKTIAKELAEKTGQSKNELYQQLLSLKEK